MKESISYTFILNIVILFIFICFAVIMGIFSYYRAFKAGVIITDTIEKYEGYNCISAEEIKRKLATISYNVPFRANCNRSDGSACMVDSDANYAVISYNLDMDEGQRYVKIATSTTADSFDETYEKMNSKYFVGPGVTKRTRYYQYGVITYMYVDLPVISNLMKISIFSKTKTMYEFRKIVYNTDTTPTYYDEKLVPEEYSGRIGDFASFVMGEYASASTGGKQSPDPEYNAKYALQLDWNGNGAKKGLYVGYILRGFPHPCNYKTDYSKY